MRITHVETFIAGNPWKNWLFTRVHTDEGITGISEGTVNAFAKTVEAAVHELKPMYEGMDPFRPEQIAQRMYRDVYTDGGVVHKHAVSAIEVACWDIIGKSLGVPCWKLLGGQVRQQVKAYANGWYRGDRTPENFHKLAKGVVDRGYHALKFDPFGSAPAFLTKWQIHADTQDHGIEVGRLFVEPPSLLLANRCVERRYGADDDNFPGVVG